MSDWSPKSVWDRLRRALGGWIDSGGEVDEADLAFHLVFIAPLFLTFIYVVRRMA